MDIYIDEHRDGKRTGNRLLVYGVVVKKNTTSIFVRLKNGDVIKRKIKRDLVNLSN